jgi:hypothetical protein
MNIVCLKWGDKFSHEHVNRLYRMVCKNFHDDFNFICHTENANGIDRNIIIQPLPDYDLENWWWKLTLFEHPTKTPTMFLDLDVVIQNDITHFKDYCVEDMLCLIKAYWKPYDIAALDTNLNSSIMIWSGDCTDLWVKFEKDLDYYMVKYNGIDSYLDHDQNEKLLYIPRNKVYSRLYGIDENNYWRARDNIKPNYYFKSDYIVCIFNGWRRKTDVINNEYLLDNEGYNGYEHYWD